MDMRASRVTPLIVAVWLIASPLGAQETEPSFRERLEKMEVVSTASLGVYAGIATFGRFLEQRIEPGRERELTAGPNPSVGGSVGFSPWNRTGVRVGLSWSPLTLEFKDDTGDRQGLLDREDVLDLDAYILTGELVRFLLDEQGTVVPYAMAGFSWTVWKVDESQLGEEIQADDDTFGRFGATGSVGLQVRISPSLSVRAEFTTGELGNPFEGDNALRASEGVTFGEPSRVNRTTLGLGLIYSFTR